MAAGSAYTSSPGQRCPSSAARAPTSPRRPRSGEYVEVLRSLWDATGPTSHHGEFDDARPAIRPVEPIPLSNGGSSEAAYALGGALALPLALSRLSASVALGGALALPLGLSRLSASVALGAAGLVIGTLVGVAVGYLAARSGRRLLVSVVTALDAVPSFYFGVPDSDPAAVGPLQDRLQRNDRA